MCDHVKRTYGSVNRCAIMPEYIAMNIGLGIHTYVRTYVHSYISHRMTTTSPTDVQAQTLHRWRACVACVLVR